MKQAQDKLDNEEKQKRLAMVRNSFGKEKDVRFAYLFGSLASGKAGPLSDIDLAIWVADGVDVFSLRLRLMKSLSKALKADNFDLVVLNRAPLILKFHAIKGGVILKDDREARVAFETKTTADFLDTAYLRLVQLRAAKRQIEKGVYFG